MTPELLASVNVQSAEAADVVSDDRAELPEPVQRSIFICARSRPSKKYVLVLWVANYIRLATPRLSWVANKAIKRSECPLPSWDQCRKSTV